jgi:hypothetical protein
VNIFIQIAPIIMLVSHLYDAGFFPIQWPLAAPKAAAGNTYVRPCPQGVVRVFVPAEATEVEVYAGSLTAGELRYRGPAPSENELRQLILQTFGRPVGQTPLLIPSHAFLSEL